MARPIELWRLCQRRPEVGFDHYYPWGSWRECLLCWVSHNGAGHGGELYLQRCPTKGSGRAREVATDAATLEKERKAIGLWTHEELQNGGLHR